MGRRLSRTLRRLRNKEGGSRISVEPLFRMSESSMSLSSANSPRATEPNSRTSHTPAPANASPARPAASADGTALTSASVTATTATLPASCRLRFACRRQGGGQILEHQAPVRVRSPARDAGGPPTSAWVSVAVAVVTSALEADAPIGLGPQAPACEGTRRRRRGRNARPYRQPKPTRADAQTGDSAPAGPGLPRPWALQPPPREPSRLLNAEAHQLATGADRSQPRTARSARPSMRSSRFSPHRTRTRQTPKANTPARAWRYAPASRSAPSALAARAPRQPARPRPRSARPARTGPHTGPLRRLV